MLVRAKGKLDRPVDFAGETFTKGETVRGTYRFDSYRLTYLYDFMLSPPVDLGLGLTAKIRDAGIAFDGKRFAESTNTGFVPLIHIRMHWTFSPRWGLLLEGDGLAAPQGRAEDFLLAFTLDANEHVTLRAGYRILEGGVDNDEVYTFALFHYASLGLTATL